MKYKVGVVVGDLVLLEDVGGTGRQKVFRCLCNACSRECVRHMGAIYQGAKSCEDCTNKAAGEAVAESNKARTVHGGGVRSGGDPRLKQANRCWSGIKQRCFNPKSSSFKNYGERGITMYEAWVNDFPKFLEDVGLPPSPKHSLDRYPNNDGSYEPGNVRWATKWEQANNRRDTLLVEWKGKTQNLAEWAAELGLPYYVVYQRFKRGETGEYLFRPVGWC